MAHDANQSDSPTITSTSLILRIQAKDQVAWDRFARLYTPYVYGLCRANGLQDSDAEDVSQNVLRSIVSGIGSYQRTGSFRGWISQVTRNRIIDHHRRQRRQPSSEGGTDFQIQISEVPDVLVPLSSQSAVAGDPLLLQALSLGISKVGVASQCRSCEICLRLMRGEGETSLGLDGGWQVFFAPGFHQLHGSCFQGYFDS